MHNNVLRYSNECASKTDTEENKLLKSRYFCFLWAQNVFAVAS